MRATTKPSATLLAIAMASVSVSAPLSAQQPESREPNIVVVGEPLPDLAGMTAGPEIKGVISARHGDKIKVTSADGASSVVTIHPATRISGGSRADNTAESLLNGLPVTIKTLQWSGGLVASQVRFRNSDLRTARMIHNATAQRFDEQSAATEALRGRMGDIDQYNIKKTTNVFFDTGKSALSVSARAELCVTVAEADRTNNALLLVVGYTDSTGSDELNQRLSERRASSVINYLQQVCHWKPYRMLTPTGMAAADPQASNDTAEGRALNRRVSVNILVSKALDGM